MWTNENNETGFALADEIGRSVPLQGVEVAIELGGPLAHTRITQRFANLRKVPIEAVYAFPVPAEAVLLGMDITIGEKTLRGVVRALPEAEREYDLAVAEGDGAFLLRRLSNGAHQIRLGNVLPGETVAVTIVWAEVLHWNRTQTRYRLPTVIAPHYGKPAKAGLAAGDVQGTSLQVAYPIRLALSVTGALATCTLASPTHALQVQAVAGGLTATLARDAALDRDFVVQISAAAQPPCECWAAVDGDETVLLGSLVVPALGVMTQQDAVGEESAPLSVAVVLDCSGSMNGDSIAQSRKALATIVDELADGDRLWVLRFGSRSEALTKDWVTLDRNTRIEMKVRISEIDADLGGTEIFAALDLALKAAPEGAPLLLITDGQAYAGDADIARRANQGHPIFTVGVGAAVSEKLVRELAEGSGAAFELVTPNERMADTIVAQVRRMRMTRVSARVEWPGEPTTALPLPRALFESETALVGAVVSGRVTGPLNTAFSAGNATVAMAVPVHMIEGALGSALPRILAARRITTGMDATEATELAVRHQLVTERTAMVAVLARAEGEQTDGMPELAEVPQMLAAGWGGTGSVMSASLAYSISPSAANACYHVETPVLLRSTQRRSLPQADGMDTSIPAFLRRSPEIDRVTPAACLKRLCVALAKALKDDGGVISEAFIATLLADPEIVPIRISEALRGLAESARSGLGDQALHAVMGAFLVELANAVGDKERQALATTVASGLGGADRLPAGVQADVGDLVRDASVRQWAGVAEGRADDGHAGPGIGSRIVDWLRERAS